MGLKKVVNGERNSSLTDSHKVTISRLNRIGRQLHPVKLAAGEWAVNWQTTSEYQTQDRTLWMSIYSPSFSKGICSKFPITEHYGAT